MALRQLAETKDLLDELEHRPADMLEDQDLEFKEWVTSSKHDAVRAVIDISPSAWPTAEAVPSCLASVARL